MTTRRLSSAYMSGPLSGLQQPEDVKAFYEAIAQVCAQANVKLYLPHQVSDPLGRPDLTPAEVYAMDRAQVAASNFVIAYVGLPSLGVGSEIEIAREYGVPVVLLAEKHAQISRMARGNPAVVAELLFVDFADALATLSHWLSRWLSPWQDGQEPAGS
jgi:2'-deoxynucleoside 5'-phosphate N-hydrolase